MENSKTAESKKHTKTQNQLEMLKSIILLFTPYFCYGILRYLKFKEINSPEEKDFEQKREKACGLYLKDWPQDIKIEYHNLIEELPLECLQDLFAEIHYFLIFYIAKNSMEYFIIDTERKLLLDYLFNESFSDREVWSKKYPAPDSFERYNRTEDPAGPLKEFTQRVCQIIDCRDPWIEARLFAYIGSSLKHIVQLYIKDVLSETGHKFFKTN